MNHIRRWPHKRLKVYTLALDLAVQCAQLAATIPRGHRGLCSQLTRASLSISRHIAEGASRISHADKRSRFNVARGEAAECEAILEIVQRLGLCEEEHLQEARRLADEVAAMLYGLIKREDRFAQGVQVAPPNTLRTAPSGGLGNAEKTRTARCAEETDSQEKTRTAGKNRKEEKNRREEKEYE